MARFMASARRWCIIGLMSCPLLAQTQGCGDAAANNDLREGVASAVTEVVTAATTYLLSNTINRLLDVPISPFARFGF